MNASHARKALLAVVAVLVAAALALVGCASPADSSSSASASSASASSASSSSSSAAADQVTVPNVKGLAQTDAEKDIRAAGLTVGTVTNQESDTVAKGDVISQDPTGFMTVKAGSKVNLVVSSGKAEARDVQVPDLRGKTKAEAKKALEDAKLVAIAGTPEETTEVEVGKVFKQSVEPGATVKEGTSVTYIVAAGAAEVAVPDVVGKTRAEAEAAIAEAKLTFAITESHSDSVAEGVVISQSHAAGSKLRAGSAVTVDVSLGPVPPANVQVPDVTSSTWGDAEAALTAAGLQAAYAGDAQGVVVAQDVAAGTEVAQGSLVTVTLEVPVKKVAVPNLVGLSPTIAEETLSDAGLAIEIAEGGIHGTVAAQTPAAGTEVDEGSTVKVTVDDPDFRDSSESSPASSSSSASSASASSASSPSASASSGSASASPASTPATPAAADYVGVWDSERPVVEITQKGGAYHVLVSWGASATEMVTWEYDCAYDNGKLVAKGGGVKTDIVSDGGKEKSEVVYSDGSATFALDESGVLTWKDNKEDAGAGMKFTR